MAKGRWNSHNKIEKDIINLQSRVGPLLFNFCDEHVKDGVKSKLLTRELEQKAVEIHNYSY